MFDIGFSELCLVAVIALLVVGPKRLPETVRAWGRWAARARHALETVRREVEQELDLEDVRRIGQEYRRDRVRDPERSRAAPPAAAKSDTPATIRATSIAPPDAPSTPDGHGS